MRGKAYKEECIGTNGWDCEKKMYGIYEEEKWRVKKSVYQNKEEGEWKIGKMNQDVSGNINLFWKEMGKVNDQVEWLICWGYQVACSPCDTR